MLRFDIAHMISYYRSIVTMAYRFPHMSVENCEIYIPYIPVLHALYGVTPSEFSTGKTTCRMIGLPHVEESMTIC